MTKAAEAKVANHSRIHPTMTNPQGRSHDFFFFFLPSSANSTTDMEVPVRVIAVSGRFPSRSLDGVIHDGSLELFSVGCTSKTDATGFDFSSFNAFATREGRLFLGRDFRKIRMIRKLTGKTMMLLTTPMYIYFLKKIIKFTPL